MALSIKKYFAEFIGTFVLVAFGCGSAVAANSIFISMGSPLPVAFTTLLIAFAFGLSVVAMMYSIGTVSGCHVNPAVSLGMLIDGRMNLKDFICYVVAQLLGALAAALSLMVLFGGREALGANGYGEASAVGTSAAAAVGLEIVLTLVFVLVVLAVTARKEYSQVAGIVIGLTLTLVHIFGLPFTGTSVNPARSFGPAIVTGGNALAQLPVFIIAPLIGGAIAALIYKVLFSEKPLDALSHAEPAGQEEATDFVEEREEMEPEVQPEETEIAEEVVEAAPEETEAEEPEEPEPEIEEVPEKISEAVETVGEALEEAPEEEASASQYSEAGTVETEPREELPEESPEEEIGDKFEETYDLMTDLTRRKKDEVE